MLTNHCCHPSVEKQFWSKRHGMFTSKQNKFKIKVRPACINVSNYINIFSHAMS